MFVAGIWLLYFQNKIQPVMEVSFWIGVLGCLLYVLIIPESPIWYFLKDPNSKAGIEILNGIAKINGSVLRIPEDATLDLIGNAIKENETLMKTKNPLLRMRLNQTINDTLRDVIEETRPK
jgi:hypothetical protein